MNRLELKIPPPLVMVVFAILMWWVASLTTAPIFYWLSSYGSVLFLLLGIVVIMSGLIQFRKSQTTVDPMHPEAATSLVIGGVYRFTRNPMYVGLTLVLISWGCFLSNSYALLLIPLFVLYLTRFQIIPEERMLVSLFNKQYQGYQNTVRRWL